MCGIYGFIGKSKAQDITYQLTHALMIKTETRGSDATGFWATERGVEGGVWYDKEPIKSTIYSDRKIWKAFEGVNCDLFLGHCRAKSIGVGNEKANINNHPHVNEERSVAIVHNGRIHDYDVLKNRYNVRGECDSELILSMYMSGYTYKNDKEFLEKNMAEFEPDLAYRAAGMIEIFKYIDQAALAVAIGDRGDNGERYLWLHRNSERPIHFVDLRETLGQVFYFSTVDIWKSAVNSLPSISKQFIPVPHKIAVFPTDEMWLWKITPDAQDNDVWVKDRYKILRSKAREYSEDDIPKQKTKAVATTAKFNITSRLNEYDKLEEDIDDTAIEVPSSSSAAETMSVVPLDSETSTTDGKKKE